MLNVKLGKVIKYANLYPDRIEEALNKFFGKNLIDPQMEYFDKVSELFNEWLIFDFKSKDITFIIEYYLKNPDELSNDLLEELKQIIETQCFDMLEMQSIKRGEWIKAYGLYSGKTYQIYDHRGSLSSPDKGTFWGRIAKVDNRYQLVGSNPLFYPTIATDRLKKFYLENKPKHFSPKDVLTLLLPSKTKRSDVFEKIITKKGLKRKRENIKKRFKKLQESRGFFLHFKDIVSFVYKESYKDNFADYFPDLVKFGIPEEIIFSHPDLFNDIWNFFPHKTLHGKSPCEMYQDKYK